jgi:uncharacterized protein involved in exopolysaccharide biosynthesis
MNIPEAIPHFQEADSFNFRESWQALVQAYRRDKKLVWGIAAATVALVSLYIVVWPPVYTGEVLLAASSPKDDQRDQFYSMWAVFRGDDLADDVQLFTSKPVLAEVVKRMHLTYDDVYHPPLSHAGYLWQQSWPGRGWRAVKNFIVPPTYGPYSPTPEQIDFARTVDDFQSGVSVQPVPETNIGRLVVRAPSPRVAEIANEIVKVYFEQRRERQAAEADASYKALEAVTEQARKDLLGLEQQMQRYYTQNDMLLMFEKDKIEVSQWLTAKATIQDLQSNVAANERELATINRRLSSAPAEILSSRTMQANPVAEGIKDKISQVELARKMALLHYRPDSPEVAEFDRQKAALESQLAAVPATTQAQSGIARNPEIDALLARKTQLEAGISGQRAAIAVRSGDARDLQSEVDQIPEKMKVSHDLGREHDALEKKYSVLRDKLMIAAVSAATVRSAPNPIRVVDPASAPAKPSWPKTKLLLLAALVFGLFVGLATALLLNVMQGWVNRSRVAKSPAAPPLYGVVGRDGEFARKLFRE